MIGIYKITSPTGKVYIGQSWNIEARWRVYSNLNCHDGKLLSSLKKHGYLEHKADVLHELPKDVDQSIMNAYEQIYIDIYRDGGFVLLNLREAGSNGRHSSESIERMKVAFKGRVITDEAKRKMSLSKIGKKQSPEHSRKSAAYRKGKPLSKVTLAASIKANKGSKRTDEAKLKMSLAKKGKPWSEKRIEAEKNRHAKLSPQ